MVSRHRREKRRRVLVIAAVAVLILALLAVYLMESANNRGESSGDMPGVSDADLARQGSAASGRTALLLIGIDKFQDEMKDVGYMNNQQSDFVTLLIFNHDEQSYAVIHFNRDTICDVTRYGLGGKKVDTIPLQLALSHTYGDGGQLSCSNTVASVNSMLPEIYISNYAAVSMEAVVELTDLCGGIPIYVDDDYTMVDPSFRKGVNITLDGEHALEFIRMRRALADASNARRMDRQRTYLSSMADRMLKNAAEDPSFGVKAADAVKPYLTTDAGDYDLAEYMSWMVSYEFTGITTPEGTLDDSGKYVEFHPDRSSLKEIVKTYWK